VALKESFIRPKVKVTEKAIMQQIKYALSVYGWFVFRVPPSVYGQKGLCDLIAIKNGMVVFIEVKAENGRQSDEQKVFEAKINSAGGIYILARSIDDVEWLFRLDWRGYAGACCRTQQQ